jgi:predicted DNA-binding protein (UPF0251 family)
MGRIPNWRRVSVAPEVTYFKPRGIPAAILEEVNLTVDEAEAIRLKDLEGMDQETCADSMRVSRTTFARVLESARQKIADALLNGKAIRIGGGNFEMAQRPFRCLRGHEWNVPFEVMTSRPPEACPRCKTPNILPLQPPGLGWGKGGWGRRHRVRQPQSRGDSEQDIRERG